MSMIALPEGRMERSNAAYRRARRGQGIVEFALILPVLIILLATLLEGGLALNAWLRVNTAARDGTRFALDGARPNEVRDLVRDKLQGFDPARMDIYLIQGKTSAGGAIPNNATHWNEQHLFGSRSGGANVDRAGVVAGLGGAGNPDTRNIPFTIVEVDYVYQPLFLRVLTGGNNVPMSSFAIVQQYGQPY